MLWQLVLLATGIWALYYRWKRRRICRISKEIPFCGLPHIPLLGQAHLYAGTDKDRMNTFQALGRAALKHGGMSTSWLLNKLYVVAADPVQAEVILKSCLDKDDFTQKHLRALFGNGNLFAPVSIWRPRRKILAPIFSIKNINSFLPVFEEQSNIMVKLLEREVGKSQFSIWKYITTYTFDAICKTNLGVDLKSQQQSDQPFLEAFDVNIQLLAERVCSPWLYLDCVYERLQRYKTFKATRDFMYQFVDEIIKTKRAELAERNKDGRNKSTNQGQMLTFLEMLIESSGAAKGYTDVELREEILVIIVAGTDTSAAGVAFTALMLSRYPDVQEKVYQELQEVFGDTNRPVTVQDLPRLKYLEAVMKETLRMYPAVPVIVREVFDDLKLPSGTTLVDGVGVLISFWAMHRNPVYWGDDADSFRPERFLEGPLKHPAQFVPFSYSLRNCVGSLYAMMSMKTVLSTLLRRYRLLPPADMPPHLWKEPLKVKFDIMMKHVDNYMIRLEHRNKVQDSKI